MKTSAAVLISVFLSFALYSQDSTRSSRFSLFEFSVYDGVLLGGDTYFSIPTKRWLSYDQPFFNSMSGITGHFAYVFSNHHHFGLTGQITEAGFFCRLKKSEAELERIFPDLDFEHSDSYGSASTFLLGSIFTLKKGNWDFDLEFQLGKSTLNTSRIVFIGTAKPSSQETDYRYYYSADVPKMNFNTVCGSIGVRHSCGKAKYLFFRSQVENYFGADANILEHAYPYVFESKSIDYVNQFTLCNFYFGIGLYK